MMCAFPVLCLLASAVVLQAGDAGTHAVGTYEAVMKAQYAARAEPLPQPPEEARRIYDAYLNAIGQRATRRSNFPLGSAEDQSR